MRFFKRLSIMMLLGALIIAGMGFMLPDQYKIEREITIQAPQDVIFREIQNLINWEYWHPWQKDIHESPIEYSTISFGEGAWQRWKSKSMGKGEITIKRITENELLLYERTYIDYGFVATGEFIIEPLDLGTSKLIWKDCFFTGNNIIKRYFGLFAEATAGSELESSLQNLKNRIEQQKLSLW